MNLLATLPLWAVCATKGRRYDMAVIPSTSVDLTTEVGQVLNDAGGSVNINQPSTYFTEDAKINKWAKYKPVAHTDLFRAEGEYNTSDGKAGLTINYVLLSDSGTYTQNAIRALYNDSSNWAYTLPTGGASSPFRLGDFRGYQANSYPLAQGYYTKGQINEVPTGTGVFSYPYSCYLPNDSADSDGDGAPFALANNLQFSDITMYIEGAYFNLGDGYLCCFVVKQANDPIVNGFNYFDISSLRVCNETLANGGNYIAIYDFVTGVDSSATSGYYWLIGGILLKGNGTDIFLSMPYYDDSHYHTTAFYTYSPSYWMSLEITGWSKYPMENVWHDIVWAQTDDYIALPVSANTYLKLRVDVDLSGWSSNTFTFTAQNTRIYCSTTGITRYCSIYDSNFGIQSSGGVITDHGTLYLGADDLFGMAELYDQYDIEIQVNVGNDTWRTLVWVGFEGRNEY